MCSRTSGSMPEPVSATANRIPVCEGFFQSRERRARTNKPAAVAARVNRIAHQVGEHLPDLSGKAEQDHLRLIVPLHANIRAR